MTIEHFRRFFCDFLVFDDFQNLGGRGSISASVSIKMKLSTPNSVDSFSKHSSFIQLHQKSPGHHGFVFTETDM